MTTNNYTLIDDNNKGVFEYRRDCYYNWRDKNDKESYDIFLNCVKNPLEIKKNKLTEEEYELIKSKDQYEEASINPT